VLMRWEMADGGEMVVVMCGHDDGGVEDGLWLEGGEMEGRW